MVAPFIQVHWFFLNASNYVFPTNHFVWYCWDEIGGGGDSREENIDRSFHPKSRLRITFFFLFYYFFHLTKKTGLQFHPSTTCKYFYWVKRGRKKKTWMGRHSPIPDVVLLRFNECWETASVTWTQPNRWKKNSYIDIFIYIKMCIEAGVGVWHLESGQGLSANLSECSLKLKLFVSDKKDVQLRLEICSFFCLFCPITLWKVKNFLPPIRWKYVTA